MQFVDTHTHSKAVGEGIAICNCEVSSLGEGGFFSIGIHPWNIAADWEQQFAAIADAARCKSVAAIGECGFDTLKSPATIEEQQRIFAAHIALSEQVQKPLIIHLVKAQEQLLKAANRHPRTQAWIVHGFRGNPTQAAQLLSAGFHLSFGEKFNTESVKTVPLERIFVESDVSTTPLHRIYESIAAAKGITIETLAEAVMKNAEVAGLRL